MLHRLSPIKTDHGKIIVIFWFSRTPLPCPVLSAPTPATAPCTIHFLAVLRIDSPSCRWRESGTSATAVKSVKPRSKSLAHAHATHLLLPSIHPSPSKPVRAVPRALLDPRRSNRKSCRSGRAIPSSAGDRHRSPSVPPFMVPKACNPPPIPVADSTFDWTSCFLAPGCSSRVDPRRNPWLNRASLTLTLGLASCCCACPA